MASLSYDLSNRIKDEYSFLPITLVAISFKRCEQINKQTEKINKNYELTRENIDKI